MKIFVNLQDIIAYVIIFIVLLILGLGMLMDRFKSWRARRHKNR